MGMIRVCDRCRIQLGPAHMTTRIKQDENEKSKYVETLGLHGGEHDLCESCAVSFRLWWRRS